jgi:hypothetical protein
MLLQAEQNTEELLVSTLAESGPVSASVLHQELAAQGKPVSVQAVYKALGGLEEQGVIVKEGRRYGLRAPWVLDLANLTQRALSLYADPSASLQMPIRGKRQIWHFNDLLKLNNFWSQVLLVLVKRTNESVLLSWMPHPWYHLVYSRQEEQYLKALELSSIRLYLINEGTSYLDRWTGRYWEAEHIDYSFGESPFSKEEMTHYYNVLGDYVVTVRLDTGTAEIIDQLYRETGSAEKLDPQAISRIFSTRVRASLWLEHNPEKAKEMRRRFVRHFGPLKGQKDA